MNPLRIVVALALFALFCLAIMLILGPRSAYAGVTTAPCMQYEPIRDSLVRDDGAIDLGFHDLETRSADRMWFIEVSGLVKAILTRNGCIVSPRPAIVDYAPDRGEPA